MGKFTTETAPKGKGGATHKKTKVKQAIGLDNWQNFCNYVVTNGVDKLIDEMNKLKGKDFVIAFSALIEFVKPKLSRTTLEGDKEVPIEIFINGSKAN